MIKNFLKTPEQHLEKSHNGQGPFSLFEIWAGADFKSNIDFFDRIIIPPNSTVGIHKHGDNEEIYIVLRGGSTMIINGKETRVEKGDMILNPSFGEHGLINNSGEEIDILIVQVSC